MPWEDVFASIEPEPLAAGTIGQVHRARARERRARRGQGAAPDRGGGHRARPQPARALRREDRRTARRCAGSSTSRRRSSTSPTRCAASSTSSSRPQNVERLRAALDRLPAARRAARLRGALDQPAARARGDPRRAACARSRTAPSAREAARQLLECYYRQILVEGFFHADPHPGNMLWADERIFFLDFGMVGELSPEMRGQLLLLLLAFWQEDVPFLTEVVLIMAGPEAEDADAAGLEADLDAAARSATGTPRSARSRSARCSQEIAHTSTQHGVRLPASLVADRQGARADAARRRRARPGARPVLGRRRAS